MMNYFKGLIYLILTVSSVQLSAQNSIIEFIKDGNLSGNQRTFLMATDNQDNLMDWYGLSTGGNVNYSTTKYNGFSLSLGYYGLTNVFGNSNLKDSITGKQSRYVLGNYDFADINNRTYGYVGEAVLKYKSEQFHLNIGRFKYKSPLLNPQDGSMLPTLVQGLNISYNVNSSITTEFSWFESILARSSSRFLSIEESFGVYPQGLSVGQGPSKYKGNLNSNGIFVSSIKYKSKTLNFRLYNYTIENVLNSMYVDVSKQALVFGLKSKFSFQYIRQDNLNRNTNLSVSEMYMSEEMAQVFGAKYQIAPRNKMLVSLNANYITDQGRFLFPREWGIEPLYTFQKRERLEGMSNTFSWMIDFKNTLLIKETRKINYSLSYGHYYRPDIQNHSQNKYLMPANSQLTFDVLYLPQSIKKGFVLEWITAFKSPLSNDEILNMKAVLNKVNMISHNLILNYYF